MMLQRSNSCVSVPGWIQGVERPAQHHGINCLVLMKVPFWGLVKKFCPIMEIAHILLECVSDEGATDQMVVGVKMAKTTDSILPNKP